MSGRYDSDDSGESSGSEFQPEGSDEDSGPARKRPRTGAHGSPPAGVPGRSGAADGAGDEESEESEEEEESEGGGEEEGEGDADYVPPRASDDEDEEDEEDDEDDEDDEEGEGEADASQGAVDPRQLDTLVKRFVVEAAQWAEANGQRIKGAYDSAGGWEVWLEVELYLWLTEHAPELNVSRQNPYPRRGGARQRGDLLIGDAVTIELKAETKAEDSRAFSSRVDNDLRKVDQGLGERPAVVVAFACTEPSVRELTDLVLAGPRKGGPVRIFWEASSG